MAGRVSGSRTVYTFAYLYASAARSLDRAQREEEGSYYEIINALVMAAFTFEAYANHLIEGAEVDIEPLSGSKESIWAKYKRLRKVLRISGGGIENDYPSAAKALKFRNMMAHGRTLSAQFDEAVDGDEPCSSDTYGLVDWEDFVDVELAGKAMADVERFVKTFNDAAGCGPNPLYCLASGSSIFVEE
ncbi:hypothetical protein QVM55_12670 [Pseudomonas monteilii]|uniref:hypothetical protein n=1 Tax=Pseudomonas monteilii TaxID=76759 RepID=UPI003524A53B